LISTPAGVHICVTLASAIMLVTLSSKLVGILGLGLYVSGVSATPTAFNPNTPALLVPRVLPADNTCGNKGLWQRRECDPQYGTTAWFDLCVKSGAPNFQVASRCPSNTVCQNFHDGKDSSIKCVNQQPAGTSVARSTRDPMIGYSGIFTAPSFVNRNFPFRFTVTIQDDMKASVAAFVLSKFLVQITLFWC
jgi:hypothetical protein